MPWMNRPRPRHSFAFTFFGKILLVPGPWRLFGDLWPCCRLQVGKGGWVSSKWSVPTGWTEHWQKVHFTWGQGSLGWRWLQNRFSTQYWFATADRLVAEICLSDSALGWLWLNWLWLWLEAELEDIGIGGIGNQSSYQSIIDINQSSNQSINQSISQYSINNQSINNQWISQSPISWSIGQS